MYRGIRERFFLFRRRDNVRFRKVLRFNANSVPGILIAMPDNSFDVVSIVDLPEVLNAVQQASKEVLTRFDLKNSKSEIQLNEKDKKITVTSIDEFKLKAVVDVLQQKLVKRKVPLKNFIYNPVQPAAGSTVRQEVTIQSGLAIEKSREIVRTIKDSKIKVQASIQGDLVRVSGKSRDLSAGSDSASAPVRLRRRTAVHKLPDQLNNSLSKCGFARYSRGQFSVKKSRGKSP